MASIQKLREDYGAELRLWLSGCRISACAFGHRYQHDVHHSDAADQQLRWTKCKHHGENAAGNLVPEIGERILGRDENRSLCCRNTRAGSAKKLFIWSMARGHVLLGKVLATSIKSFCSDAFIQRLPIGISATFVVGIDPGSGF